MGGDLPNERHRPSLTKITRSRHTHRRSPSRMAAHRMSGKKGEQGVERSRSRF